MLIFHASNNILRNILKNRMHRRENKTKNVTETIIKNNDVKQKKTINLRKNENTLRL